MYNWVNYTHLGNSYVLEKLWAPALTKKKNKQTNKMTYNLISKACNHIQTWNKFWTS